MAKVIPEAYLSDENNDLAGFGSKSADHASITAARATKSFVNPDCCAMFNHIPKWDLVFPCAFP